jgi:hypothetical protein
LTIQKNPLIQFHVIFGSVALHSPYLWKKGHHAKPLRDEMGISHHGRSEAVNRAVSDFGSEESFGQAAKRFTEHYHYELSSSTVSRVTKEVAEEALAYVEEKLSTAGEPEAEAEASASKHGKSVEHMLIELDACKIRTATLAVIENSKERTPVYHHPKKRKTIQWRDVRMGLSRPLDSVSKTYVGKMGSYPEVVEQLFHASVLGGMSLETDVVGVADGGIGLKESLEARFVNLQFILDKTHLKDHLYETAEEVGIRPQERPGWVTSRLKAVSRGDVAQVKQELEETYDKQPHPRLNRLLGYITRFYDAMHYDEFQANGYPIGSGEIESAHRSVPQKRLKLPGACWHPDSVNPMLALRVLRADDWWDEFWEDRTQRKMVV